MSLTPYLDFVHCDGKRECTGQGRQPQDGIAAAGDGDEHPVCLPHRPVEIRHSPEGLTMPEAQFFTMLLTAVVFMRIIFVEPVAKI
jgi:hypothetical protein